MKSYNNKNIITYRAIGYIRTPYNESDPRPLTPDTTGTYKVVLGEEFSGGLYRLDSFTHIIVLFSLDRVNSNKFTLTVFPPFAPSIEVGIFASRSPNRPNPIGMSIVEILHIENNIIYISPIDAFDGTPVLDIKPYIPNKDSIHNASGGWTEESL